MVKVKVKCTLVRALRLCTGLTAHRGNRGIALLSLAHGSRRGWGVSVTPRPLFTPGKDPVPTVQEAGWAPGPVWTGAENLAPTGIRSPDRPAHSQSLYRLRHPAHVVMVKVPNLFLDREAGIVFENTVPFFYHLYTMNPCVSNAEFFGQNRPTVKQILASVFIILNYKFFASVCDSETFFFFIFGSSPSRTAMHINVRVQMSVYGR